MSGRDHAVVIGASVAGLLAAAALGERYDKVTILDRDSLPAEPAARRGVPQGRHVHALLARSLQSADQLLPGFTGELAAAGASVVDLQRDTRIYLDGHCLRPTPSGVPGFGLSRVLFEHILRTRVAASSAVQILDEHTVAGLIAAPDGTRVTGVRIAGGSTLDADLVVDAGGAGSRSHVWLAELGYAAAPQETVKVDVTYVTRYYRREQGQVGGVLGVGCGAYPGMPRGGGLASQEDDRFAVALIGLFGEQPPTDDAGMAAFAKSLPATEIAEIVGSATPLGPAVKMRYPASVRRRYERLRRFPEGYLVTGDALCSFNPTYGQGITVAAMEAVLLQRLLATSGIERLAPRFFAAAAKLVDIPWSMAAGADLRFPEVEGKRPLVGRLTGAYFAQLYKAAAQDVEIGRAFIRVMNLIDPPTRMFAPAIVWRVLQARRSANGSVPA
jgi:2-polyprenyl-6-methoxyphenol hydroxylase-like FAD-dependent oxidoreductase